MHVQRNRLAALIFCATVVAPSSVVAAVKVELSDTLAHLMRSSNLAPEAERQRLEKDFNAGLAELGRSATGPKALHDSGQKIRIVCFAAREARNAGLRQDSPLESAETKGDFGRDKRPRPGGTAIIAIDCEALARVRSFDRVIVQVGATMNHILLHELLHATSRDRRHPPDPLEVYDIWVRDFAAALARLRHKGS